MSKPPYLFAGRDYISGSLVMGRASSRLHSISEGLVKKAAQPLAGEALPVGRFISFRWRVRLLLADISEGSGSHRHLEPLNCRNRVHEAPWDHLNRKEVVLSPCIRLV